MSRFQPNPPPESAAQLDAWTAFADHVLDLLDNWIAQTKWEPAADSPYSDEVELLGRQYGPAGDWDDSAAENARRLASTFLQGGRAHLEGLLALFKARQAVVPTGPVVRSLFEMCSRVAWLLEPVPYRPGRLSHLDVRVRAARVIAMQIEDLTRAKAVAVSLHAPNAPKLGQALRTLRSVTVPGLFYKSEIVEHDGDLELHGQRLPGHRKGGEEFERIHVKVGAWQAGGLYDLLSNASHPTPSMLIGIGTPNAQGLLRFDLEDVTYPIRAFRVATIAVLHTWSIVGEYLGHDPERILDPLRTEILSLPDP